MKGGSHSADKRAPKDGTASIDDEFLPSDLLQLVDVIESLLKRKGIVDSRELATDAAIELSRSFGGRQMYLPKGPRVRQILIAVHDDDDCDISSSVEDQIADMFEASGNEAWTSYLVKMVDALSAFFKQKGLHKAMRVAADVATEIAFFGGGSEFYIPKADRLRRMIRDNEIYERFPHVGSIKLAEEFGLSDRHVWRICKQVRDSLRKKRKEADAARTNAR